MLTISLLSMFRRAVYRFSTVRREERRRLKEQIQLILEQPGTLHKPNRQGTGEGWGREIVLLFG